MKMKTLQNQSSLSKMLKTFGLALSLTAAAFSGSVLADQVQTRASSFEYFDALSPWAGMIQAEVIEPDTPDLCVRTVYEYDNNNAAAVKGNKTKTTVRPCVGVSVG